MSEIGHSKKEELEKRLQKHGIPVGRWGEGAAKTFEHLFQEVISGESILESSNDALLRKFKVVGVDVLFKDMNGKIFRLKEEKQVFTDGRERRRDLATSLAEKIKPDEEPTTAARRAVLEELGISTHQELKSTGNFHVSKPSTSFPGINSDYNAFMYVIELIPSQFKPEGYIEVQKDKKTYFVWEEQNPQS